MDYNYHTHTPRCSHASGSAEEYIQRAIAGGIKRMGFSEHTPFKFPDGHESWYRLPVAEISDYFEEISALREKYKDKIDIKIGFETEWYPKHIDTMLETAISAGAEYLILGHHFLDNENGAHVFEETNSVDDLNEYTSTIITAMNSGYFSYVAHPDALNFTGDEQAYRNAAKRLCTEAKKLNLPLEINFMGIRSKRNYPCEIFWEVAGETGAPVTFGFDAHDTLSAYDETSLAIARKIVCKYNLNYIGEPKLIDVQKKYK